MKKKKASNSVSKPAAKPSAKPKPRKIHREAAEGRIVTEQYAQENPLTTVTEVVGVPSAEVFKLKVLALLSQELERYSSDAISGVLRRAYKRIEQMPVS